MNSLKHVWNSNTSNQFQTQSSCPVRKINNSQVPDSTYSFFCNRIIPYHHTIRVLTGQCSVVGSEMVVVTEGRQPGPETPDDNPEQIKSHVANKKWGYDLYPERKGSYCFVMCRPPPLNQHCTVFQEKSTSRASGKSCPEKEGRRLTT